MFKVFVDLPLYKILEVIEVLVTEPWELNDFIFDNALSLP